MERGNSDQEEWEPITLNGDDLHDAAIALECGRWTCRLCGRQAMHADGTRGYGIMHTDACFLVTAGIIRNHNRRGISCPTYVGDDPDNEVKVTAPDLSGEEREPDGSGPFGF